MLTCCCVIDRQHVKIYIKKENQFYLNKYFCQITLKNGYGFPPNNLLQCQSVVQGLKINGNQVTVPKESTRIVIFRCNIPVNKSILIIWCTIVLNLRDSGIRLLRISICLQKRGKMVVNCELHCSLPITLTLTPVKSL